MDEKMTEFGELTKYMSGLRSGKPGDSGSESETEDIIKPGRYRHYKGNEYEVLFTAKHSEIEELMVVYKALYGEGQIWVRPASMWNETVVKDGKELKRFTYVVRNEMEKYLIANITKEERIALIRSWVPDDEILDNCDIDLWDMYADYINGKKEISECNADFTPDYIADDDSFC